MPSDSEGPITGLCIVSDPEKCPPGYELVRILFFTIWHPMLISGGHSQLGQVKKKRVLNDQASCYLALSVRGNPNSDV